MSIALEQSIISIKSKSRTCPLSRLSFFAQRRVSRDNGCYVCCIQEYMGMLLLLWWILFAWLVCALADTVETMKTGPRRSLSLQRESYNNPGTPLLVYVCFCVCVNEGRAGDTVCVCFGLVCANLTLKIYIWVCERANASRMYTKIKVLGSSQRCHWQTLFGSTKNHGSLNNYLFLTLL